MKIYAADLMANPARVLDEIIHDAARQGMNSFAGADISPDELEAVRAMSADAARGAREEIRLLIMSQLRKAGAQIPDDFGQAANDDVPTDVIWN